MKTSTPERLSVRVLYSDEAKSMEIQLGWRDEGSGQGLVWAVYWPDEMRDEFFAQTEPPGHVDDICLVACCGGVMTTKLGGVESPIYNAAAVMVAGAVAMALHLWKKAHP